MANILNVWDESQQKYVSIPILKGADGEDYVLTNADKQEIADTVADACRQDIANVVVEVETKLTQHNTSEIAHNDIRLYATTLENRINAIADSDDNTLDQLSEIVTYIKNNKSLIDGVTTSKVNVTDIVDDCTTSVSNKPLSAKQGVELNTIIQNLRHDILDMTYPIGSIYMSTVETSPATLFGGTWVRIKDKFLLAAGDKYAPLSSGGEETHILTLDEIPSHAHSVGTNESVNGIDYSPWRAVGAGTSGSEGGKYYSSSTLNVGGSQAHNNMPPYSAVYIWKRTA